MLATSDDTVPAEREPGEVVDSLVGKQVEYAKEDGGKRSGMVIHQVEAKPRCTSSSSMTTSTSTSTTWSRPLKNRAPDETMRLGGLGQRRPQNLFQLQRLEGNISQLDYIAANIND
ncbi:unnamed protein product [Gadus morhua 'NCC']